LERQLSTPRRIAFERMHHLGMSINELSLTQQAPSCENNCGDASLCNSLSSVLVSLLEEVFDHWSLFCSKISDVSPRQPNQTPQTICNSDQIKLLQRTLTLLSRVSKLDITLGEEIERGGSQTICTRLIEQISNLSNVDFSEEDSDTLVELQDLVFEMYSPSKSARMGFTNDEMLSRLPLVYNFTSASAQQSRLLDFNHDEYSTILISQVTKRRQSAQADVGFVMWPSAIVLSRWISINQHVLEDKSILELGAGCGLVGITAAHIKRSQNQQHNMHGKVILTDVNELVLENIMHNIHLNDVACVATVEKLDFYSQTGCCYAGGWLAGQTGRSVSEAERAPVDVILAADVICRNEDAVAASKTIYDVLRPNGVAFVVCANAEHRFGVDIFANECQERGLKVIAETSNVEEMLGSGEHLYFERMMQSAAGYVDSMKLTFFRINKN